MKARLTRLAALSVIALAAPAAALAPSPASARVILGFGLGFPLFAPAYPPPAPVYYPPPTYYVPPPPPPAAYYPPPAAVAPAPVPAPSSAQCRPYSATAIIDGQAREATGTACLEPDGTWHIVN
jgi:hypothetical protein